MRVCLVLFALFCSLGGIGTSYAHAPDQTYLFMKINADEVGGRFEMTTKDLNDALGTDLPTAAPPDDATLAASIDRIEAYMREHVDFAVNGEPLPFEVEEFAAEENAGLQFVQLIFGFERFEAPPQSMDVRFDVLLDERPDHRNLLVVEQNWSKGLFMAESNIALVFDPGNRDQTLDFEHGSAWQGFLGMVKLGMHHIFIGLDHILFLVALLLPSVLRREDGRWQPVERFSTAFLNIVTIVTVFTIAHSITLSLGALELVTLPSRLIETIIALSIAIAAADIIVPVLHRRIWIVVFVFGLFHGLGFASVLAEFGLPPSHLVQSLIAFNVGVEIGQIAIVMLIFPALYMIRSIWLYPRVAVQAGALALIAISTYWVLERGLQYDVPIGRLVAQMLGTA
jgi:hypothetical protein